MKRYLISAAFFVVCALLLPLAVFGIMNFKKSPEKTETEKKISIFFKENNETRTMNMEDYLKGVLCAEMPATFEKEALKAQAVAARSYTYYRMENRSTEHPDCPVCTDFAHCKAYKDMEEAKKGWGKNAKEYEKKICNAVEETKGEILKYNGDAALAVFHSQAAGGRTENSEDVWGGSVPYLVSVESHGEENAPNFYSEARFSFKEFKEKLEAYNSKIKIDGAEDIGQIKLSEGGNVKSISIGGEDISGKEMRSLFGLRSSCFKIILQGETVLFEVTGYGHGVGMSQYGANTMASEGYDYKQILAHYYSGTKLEAV